MSVAPRLLIIDRGLRDQPVSYSQDWIDAFRAHAGGRVDVLSNPHLLRWGKRMLPFFVASHYDGIFVMHSVSNDYGFGYAAAQIVRKIHGPVFMFMGNEYRDLATKVGLANEMRCKYLLSQLSEDIAKALYEPFFTGDVISVPHALNEAAFQNRTPLKDRKIDIGYRGEKYPYYLGQNEREGLFKFFIEKGKNGSLNVDFAAGRGKGNRLPREGWAAFLNSCRCTVGTETGAEYLSMSDKLRFSVNAYLDEHPQATFDEVQMRVIQPLVEKYSYMSGRAISSRHFDAIGSGTALISFPGRFNDILKADEHYIRLNRDFSNIDEVLSRMADVRFLEELTCRVREMVLKAHCLKHRIRHMMDVLGR